MFPLLFCSKFWDKRGEEIKDSSSVSASHFISIAYSVNYNYNFVCYNLCVTTNYYIDKRFRCTPTQKCPYMFHMVTICKK